MATVQLTDISKSFGAVRIIENLNLSVEDRELVVFVGPSGCGKSTLLRMIAGLEEISAGALSIDGRVVNGISPADRHIAMVFQSYALYPHQSVRENLSFGLRMAKTNKAVIAEKVGNAARILELEPLLDRKPRELSGGQRQRVAIGRAIVRDPKIFLFDEPLSNLDAALRSQMRVEIAKLHRQLNATMIYVTHDQVEAMTLADRIVVLNKGAIEQVGSPSELYNKPRNLFVATFIGSPRMNLLSGTVAATDGEGSSIEFKDGQTVALSQLHEAEVGDRVTIGIRPQHLSSREAGALNFIARVEAVEYLGAETQVIATIDTGEVLNATLDGEVRVAAGESVRLSAQVGDLHLFSKTGNAFERSWKA